jgi:hypothetical protein
MNGIALRNPGIAAILPAVFPEKAFPVNIALHARTPAGASYSDRSFFS